MKKLLLLLAAVGVIFTACQGGLDNEENGGTPSTPKIELSQQTIDVGYEAATYSVSVTSPYSWEVIAKNDWIEIETKTGIAGTKVLKFTVERNEEEEIREGTILLTNSTYNLAAELYVTQKAFVSTITIEPESLTFAIEGGTQEIAIIANFEYAYSANADWLIIKESEKGISVTAPNYVEVEKRTAEITISNEKYDISKVVNVTQKAFVPEWTIEPESLTFAVEGGTKEVAITANFEYEYSTNADWLTIEKSEKGITVTVPNYVEVDKRTAEITISNEKYDISKVVNVTQGAFVPEWTIEPESLAFAVEGGKQEIAITANFEYEYSTNADWLTIEKSEKGITVTVPNYVEVDKRTAEITISNEKYDISKVVNVTQKAFVPEITFSPKSLTFDYKGGTKEVAITANFEYAYSENADWLTIEKSEKGINISATQNTKFEECTTKITISNKKYNISETISVVQKGVSAESKNVILYTSSNGKIITPYRSNVFGANIVSNTYSNGQGIIIFDAPVTSIGGSAFYRCTSLTSVTIPDSVTSIGENAFYRCTSLTSVTIPDSVTSIGYQAFSGCTSLTSVTIGDSVTSIGDSAFRDCTSLTSVTIPDSVTEIGGSAFSDCDSLKSVTIGNSVTSIGANAFNYCRSLKAFYGKFASADNRCLIIDGVLNFFASAGLTEYTISNSVTSIGERAFSDCTSLKSVTIGNSVTSIGENAFYRCTSLTSVTIPDSVTSIEDGTFAGCSSLTSVTIPDSVTSIGEKAFKDCTSLTSITIPNSVTSIGANAFSGCTGELTVNCNIPSASSYDKGAFYGSSFTKVTIGDSVTLIGDYAFYGCTSLTSVTIGNGVTSIGRSAFSGCTSLKSVTIGNSVTSIGKNAFYGCTGELIVNSKELVETDYTTSNCPMISSDGWLYGSKFTKLTIGNNITSIGDYAFYDYIYYSSLTSITIGNSVTSIGRSAFAGCTSLTSVTIPDSVTSIGRSAFSGCTSLTSVTIPDSVTSIGEKAFKDCTSLTSITIPNSVTSIGANAFSGCTGELTVNCNIPSASSYEYGAFYNSKFTKVTIGDSVTSIGSYAFYDCSSLTSVTIPDSVTEIGGAAFYGCTGELIINSKTIVEKIYTSSNYPSYSSGCWLYRAKFTKLTIGDNITSIGERAFYNCDSLTSITIPDSVTSIGEKAFCSCNSLTSITIPDSVTSIGERAFYGCTGELTVNCNIPSASSYDEGAFYGSSFTKVTIGGSVTSIGSYAFYDCSSLTSVTIPDSVTEIGGSAFYGCTGELIVNCNIPSASLYNKGAFYKSKFTKVTIGDSVTSIGSYAFYDCSSLTSVTTPNSVTSIGRCAFSGCTALTSVTIPNSVTSIGEYAFKGCSSLTSVYCKPTTPPAGDSYMFDDNASGRKIYVPTNSVSAYKAKQYWSDYASYIVGYNF